MNKIIPYYKINFIKTEATYRDRSDRSPLVKAIHTFAIALFELAKNFLKVVGNGFIFLANRGASMKQEGRVVIIGSGPSGYTAALYAARGGLKPILLEGSEPGGQLMKTSVIENYPGFPDGINGFDLMENLRRQAEKFGTEMVADKALNIDLSRYPYEVRTEKGVIQASAVILSTGATAKRLDVPGTRDGELWQKGVSTCAVCDGSLPLFRNQTLFVIGGGDTAMEDALYLSKFAKKIYVVHRRDRLRASDVLIKKVKENPKIQIIYNKEVVRVNGEKLVESIELRDTKTNKTTTHSAGGVFTAIGHTPNSAFLKGQVETDREGYVLTSGKSGETSAYGVFACGDLQDPHDRQAITAAGSGCSAALAVQKLLD